MPPRPRTHVLARRDPRLAWTVLAALGLTGVAMAAHGQSSAPAPDAPAAVQPTTPAEIEPGHTAGATGAVAGTAPQAAVPAPLPPGAHADTPGGSARNGVIAPPPTSPDPGINHRAPATGTMPVIPPPGTQGTDRAIVPK
jgi:hypothetical protein